MGTPEAAVPTLRSLAASHEVVGVYTRPDRPRGRGLRMAASPVKEAAAELGLPVFQPRTLREEGERLRGLAPDAVVVVAYGIILPAGVLAVPRLGCVNVHFSLLPRWRGAAPVARAILAGDERTGITTMLMDEGLDTGPILYREVVAIAPDDTTGTLTRRLAELAPGLVARSLEDLDTGRITPQPQEEAGATVAPKVEPEEAALDPRLGAAALERAVRAFDPFPGAHVGFRGRRLKVWKAAVRAGAGDPGTMVVADDGPALQTSDGRLLLAVVQPEGKRRMTGAEFVRGYRPAPGERLDLPM
jgi:methionyl-tRNA formyltransferase